MASFYEKQSKSILNIKKEIDTWFWDKYSLNPYRGCVINCSYCSARSNFYNSPADFGNDIDIKMNTAHLLEKTFHKSKTLKPDVFGIGGVTDAYQEAESKYRNTRKILEVLEKYKLPIHISTKSPIILDDADLLQGIAENSWGAISISLSSLNEEQSKTLEPNAISPKERIAFAKELKTKAPNLLVGATLMPILPFLGDEEEDLRKVFEAVKEAQLDYLLFSPGLSMNIGQAEYFIQFLEKQFPEKVGDYEELYRFNSKHLRYHGLLSAPRTYKLEKNAILMKLANEFEIKYRIPRFIPSDYRKQNYIISEVLLNKAYEKEIKGEEFHNMLNTGLKVQNLSDSLLSQKNQNYLAEVLRNYGKISEIIDSLPMDS